MLFDLTELNLECCRIEFSIKGCLRQLGRSNARSSLTEERVKAFARTSKRGSK